MTGICMAHSAAIDIVNRHRSTWDNWCDEYIMLMPEDDACEVEGMTLYTRGKSMHSGYDTLDRIRYACELASQYKDAVIFEYDTLLFNSPPQINKKQLFGSYKFPSSDANHRARWFLHSPWYTTQENFKRLSKVSLDIEKTYPDRWLAAACDVLGIVALGVKNGYSQNTISDPYHIIQAACNKDAGASAIHGVKDPHVFTKILAGQNAANSRISRIKSIIENKK